MVDSARSNRQQPEPGEGHWPALSELRTVLRPELKRIVNQKCRTQSLPLQPGNPRVMTLR